MIYRLSPPKEIQKSNSPPKESTQGIRINLEEIHLLKSKKANFLKTLYISPLLLLFFDKNISLLYSYQSNDLYKSLEQSS